MHSCGVCDEYNGIIDGFEYTNGPCNIVWVLNIPFFLHQLQKGTTPTSAMIIFPLQWLSCASNTRDATASEKSSREPVRRMEISSQMKEKMDRLCLMLELKRVMSLVAFPFYFINQLAIDLFKSCSFLLMFKVKNLCMNLHSEGIVKSATIEVCINLMYFLLWKSLNHSKK